MGEPTRFAKCHAWCHATRPKCTSLINCSLSGKLGVLFWESNDGFSSTRGSAIKTTITAILMLSCATARCVGGEYLLTDLGPISSAGLISVNNRGQVLGYLSAFRASVWEDGAWRTLPSGSHASWPLVMNNAGLIAGMAKEKHPIVPNFIQTKHAAFWSQDGIEFLPTGEPSMARHCWLM